MSIVTIPAPTDSTAAAEFDEIFQAHAQLVFRTAYGVTASYEDAEDVLQTVFLRLMRREATAALRQNPKAYLYRAAVNLSLDVVRSRRRLVLIPETESFETLMPQPDDQRDDKLHRRLYEGIAELKPRSAEILILRYVHNKSDAEIAKMLGVSRGTIALRLFRSRARLKKLLHARPGEKS
jgi:RNA polymerase sigma-70 factor (ECF subfamily)